MNNPFKDEGFHGTHDGSMSVLKKNIEENAASSFSYVGFRVIGGYS